MNAKETLRELVAIDSVSSRSNKDLVEYLQGRCQAAGFVVQRYSYVDENQVEKINLVALAGTQFGEQTEVSLALVGHTDTVPYDPNWNEAINLTERDGKLFGRGSCDTKGFIAATLTAATSIDLSQLQNPLALIFTADEEIGLRGAKYLAQIKPLSVRYSLIGEPTSLRPIRAGKGYALAEVILRGRESHSAYPALGASAITRAMRLIQRPGRNSKASNPAAMLTPTWPCRLRGCSAIELAEPPTSTLPPTPTPSVALPCAPT